MIQKKYDIKKNFNFPNLGFLSITKTKTILAISLAAAFAVSMIASAPLAEAAGHIFIKKTDVKVKNLTTLDVKITANAKIPKDGSAGLFGYGIITDPVAFNNVLALTTHMGAFDHTSQLLIGASNPVFHAHILDLAGAGTISDPCGGVGDAVVDFASSVGNNIDAQYKVKVKGDKIEVKKVPVSDLNDAGVEGIVAFRIIGVGSDPNAPVPLPWLCLDIVGLNAGSTPPGVGL